MARRVLCSEVPPYILRPFASQFPVQSRRTCLQAQAWALDELGGSVRAVCGFHLGQVPRQQLGLWAWTSSSVTAVAPCCLVDQGQTLPSSQGSPVSPGTPFLLDLTTWPLVSFSCCPDSLLPPRHPSIPIPLSPLVTPLG